MLQFVAPGVHPAAIRSNSVSSCSGQKSGHLSHVSSSAASSNASARRSNSACRRSSDGGIVLFTWSLQKTKKPPVASGAWFWSLFSCFGLATSPGRPGDTDSFRTPTTGACSGSRLHRQQSSAWRAPFVLQDKKVPKSLGGSMRMKRWEFSLVGYLLQPFSQVPLSPCPSTLLPPYQQLWSRTRPFWPASGDPLPSQVGDR